MMNENKPQRLVAFAGPDHSGVGKRAATMVAAWEGLPPDTSLPLPISAYQSIMDTLQEGTAAIVIEGRNGLDEIQIAQTLLMSVFLKEMAKGNADAAKAYDLFRNSLPKPE